MATLDADDLDAIRSLLKEDITLELQARKVWGTTLPLTYLLPTTTLVPSVTLYPTGG